jgi:hypothetical protein
MSNAQERISEAHKLRVELANHDHEAPAASNHPNTDEQKFQDKCGVYTKGLRHDDFGRVDPQSFATLEKAIASGKFADYEKIILGGPRTLNGPQGALQFNLEGRDESQFGHPPVPPAPEMKSAENALELLEHYWASLLRDVAFTEYPNDQNAKDAASEITNIHHAHPGAYKGPVDAAGNVTPGLLFRGGSPDGNLFPGEAQGPYVSQFMLIPTAFGQYPVTQKYLHYKSGQDFVFKDLKTWVDVQNGSVPEGDILPDGEALFLHDGRGFSSWTRVDVLYQAYFTAMLVLQSIHAPPNAGNPYRGSNVENGFGTFGGPDVSAALAEVASRAINAVWYQKWNVHLRPRPEAIGGLVHLIKIGQQNKTDCKLSHVILDSVGLQRSFDKYKTWLLSQAFPEGSPTHPSYPTGHGTVGGACITVLKFFFDGKQKLADILGNIAVPKKPQVPTKDGKNTVDYTASDAGALTVNGELNKLGHNVSFGHGIHAGIHWRSDTDTSLLLGERVALNFLRERARTYNEPFQIEIQKFDGTTATITNQ